MPRRRARASAPLQLLQQVAARREELIAGPTVLHLRMSASTSASTSSRRTGSSTRRSPRPSSRNRAEIKEFLDVRGRSGAGKRKAGRRGLQPLQRIDYFEKNRKLDVELQKSNSR